MEGKPRTRPFGTGNVPRARKFTMDKKVIEFVIVCNLAWIGVFLIEGAKKEKNKKLEKDSYRRERPCWRPVKGAKGGVNNKGEGLAHAKKMWNWKTSVVEGTERDWNRDRRWRHCSGRKADKRDKENPRLVDFAEAP